MRPVLPYAPATLGLAACEVRHPTDGLLSGAFTTLPAPPAIAAPIVDAFADALRARGVAVAGGTFGAIVRVALVDDGPATIALDSEDLDRPCHS